MHILLITLVLFGGLDFSSSQLELSSSPPTNASYCPGIVTFTCTGTNVPIGLNWVINDDVTATFTFMNTGDEVFPQEIQLNSGKTLPRGVVLNVTTASFVPPSTHDIISVLIGEVAALRGSTVQCRVISSSSPEYYVSPKEREQLRDVQSNLVYGMNLFLSQIYLQWNVSNSECSRVNYTVILENSAMVNMQEILICGSDELCMANLTTSPSSQNYVLRIIAANEFGGSTEVYRSNSIAGTLYSYTVTPESCCAIIRCSSPVNEGKCVIQYNDSTSQDLVKSMEGSLNSNITVSNLRPNTLYYYIINIIVNTTFQFTGNFTTYKVDVELSTINISLIAVGVLLLVGSLFLISGSGLLICFCLKQKMKESLPLKISLMIMIFGAAVLALVSTFLWIGAGIRIVQQNNACDTTLQSTIDELIIAAFVLSILTLLLMIPISVVIGIHVWLTPAPVQAEHLKEPWEIELEDPENAKRDSTGRVLGAEEDVATSGHRKKGEFMTDADLRVKEERKKQFDDKIQSRIKHKPTDEPSGSGTSDKPDTTCIDELSGSGMSDKLDSTTPNTYDTTDFGRKKEEGGSVSANYSALDGLQVKKTDDIHYQHLKHQKVGTDASKSSKKKNGKHNEGQVLATGLSGGQYSHLQQQRQQQQSQRDGQPNRKNVQKSSGPTSGELYGKLEHESKNPVPIGKSKDKNSAGAKKRDDPVIGQHSTGTK